jgi:hypothetical protein
LSTPSIAARERSEKDFGVTACGVVTHVYDGIPQYSDLLTCIELFDIFEYGICFW